MIIVSPQMLVWVLEEERADRLEAARVAHLNATIHHAEALLNRLAPWGQK